MTSTFGFCILIGGNLLSWKNKKQNMIIRSRVEAKYWVMALATCELMCLKQLFQELKLYESKFIEFIYDNQVALHITSNPVFHIEFDYHFI